ncbi:helix-turn-helix domain-containing protein [Sphingomonas sp. ASV193]|uniref:winged helix-turn-helix transcriptional regulator n=1 Tax=Sphingomonas sp. ASV193 TaxID=3144405 RepID=UPI0032E92933
MDQPRRINPISDCPLTAAQAAIGGRWKLIILYFLAQEPVHFAGLSRRLSSVSAKVLAEQLKELVADGLVDRTETGPAPAPVVYSLTDYGRSAIPLVDALRHFGRGHIERFGG